MRARALLVTGLVLAAAGCTTPEPPAPSPTVGPSASVRTPTAMPSPSPTPSSFGQQTLAPTNRRFRLPAAETCPPATVRVDTAAELRTAVRRARRGAVIVVASGTYRTHLSITAKATAAKPIYLCGTGRVIIDGGGSTAEPVINFSRARYWRLLDLTLQSGSTGVRGKRTEHVTLQGLTITDVGRQGVRWLDNSTDNVVRETKINDTGTEDRAAGQGVLVGQPLTVWCQPSRCEPDESDRNVIMTTRFRRTTGSAVQAYEGTYNGVVFRTRIDGTHMVDDDAWVEIRGVSWTVSDNSGRHSPHDGFRSHRIADGSGAGNIFSGNSGRDLNERGTGGYLIALRPDLTAQLSCTNKVVDKSAPVSNRRCRR